MAAESDKLSRRLTVMRRSGCGCLLIIVLLMGFGFFAGPLSGFHGYWTRSTEIYAQNNASNITKFYYHYCFDDPEPRVVSSVEAGETVASFAIFLAKNAGMNLADPWFIKTDDALGAVNQFPQCIIGRSDPTHLIIDKTFIEACPKSWAVVVNMPDPKTLDSHASTYPVIWTRGLGPKEWKKDSPWSGKGGHIGFLDGHTIWIKSTVDKDTGEGIFTDYVTGEPTSDIRKAIGPGAVVLEDK